MTIWKVEEIHEGRSIGSKYYFNKKTAEKFIQNTTEENLYRYLKALENRLINHSEVLIKEMVFKYKLVEIDVDMN